MVYIYILLLEQGKYYIGKTINPDMRIDSHFNSSGSAWTTKYKPLSIVEIIPNCDTYDEDKITIKCMHQYGIHNVRGGAFVRVKLKNTEIEFLELMIRGANDSCFKCGKNGHFASECRLHNDICDNIICIRCGRNSHDITSCYAVKHISGSYLQDSCKFNQIINDAFFWCCGFFY